MTTQTFHLTAGTWTKVGTGTIDDSFSGAAVTFADSRGEPEATFKGDSYVLQPTEGGKSLTLYYEHEVWGRVTSGNVEVVLLA